MTTISVISVLCLVTAGIHALPPPSASHSRCRAARAALSHGPLHAVVASPAERRTWGRAPGEITTQAKSGARWQRHEMLNHTVLSQEEEVKLGRRVVRARDLRARIDALLEGRGETGPREERAGDDEKRDKGVVEFDFISNELECLAVYGYEPDLDAVDGSGRYALGDTVWLDNAQHRAEHAAQMRRADAAGAALAKRARSSNTHEYTPLLRLPLHRLTDADAVSLGIPGGKAALVADLLAGARARDTLIRRNVKLVMSVARRWMLHGGDGGSARDLQKRPSLEEAAQEGALGLARAADGFDPERGLRFSTYATWWITSRVRTCFQAAATGTIRVPGQLHDLAAKHRRIVRQHLKAGTEVPGRGSIAAELGVSQRRLETALRATAGVLSLDAPVSGTGGGARTGSSAGGDAIGTEHELLLVETVPCTEPRPEEQVDLSLLRQCLENAMATELTPYERDVLRMRLGLDSGKGKTVRQIAALSGGSASLADVRSAERRAFQKLRSPGSAHARDLRAHAAPLGVDMSGPKR